MIYTGPVDEYFDYRYGRLPYRSLEFKFETLNTERHQPVAVINYPNENLYTRVTEFKYLTGQEHHKTSLVYEYPEGGGRSVLSDSAKRERRALPEVPDAARRPPRACTSSDGWRPTSTTTWIRWSRRR